jgi:ribosomal protein S27AE
MSEWALEEKKIAHDWEREDLERKRNWGIEDEKREREWMHEEQEFNRNFARRQQLEEYDWQRKIRLEDHEWQKAEKERELRWQAEDRQRAIDERQRDLEWEQRKREEQMRRENDQITYDRNRQDKFDQEQFESGRHQRVMDKLQAMAAIQAQSNAQTYQHEQNMAQINANVQMNRDNAEATMSAEALAAKQISQMDATAQAEFAKMMGSGKENELLQKQQAEQAALYQQMIQMQQNQNTQNQQMMMQMAQMMQQGMTNAANMNMANQQAFHQQQQQFQQQRAEEYKQDAYRQQDRMDANNQLAMGSLSQVTTAAAGNLYTNNTNISVHKSGNSAQFNSKSCPNCGSQLAVEDVFCGECGYSFK